jgi:hypothetical protein
MTAPINDMVAPQKLGDILKSSAAVVPGRNDARTVVARAARQPLAYRNREAVLCLRDQDVTWGIKYH